MLWRLNGPTMLLYSKANFVYWNLCYFCPKSHHAFDKDMALLERFIRICHLEKGKETLMLGFDYSVMVQGGMIISLMIKDYSASYMISIFG